MLCAEGARESGELSGAPQDSCGIDIAVADFDGRGAHYERYTRKRAVIEYVKMLWRY